MVLRTHTYLPSRSLKCRGMVQTDKAGIPVRDSAERLVPALDYPYAQDGLDIWYAMRDWFGAYLQLYYASDAQVRLI